MKANIETVEPVIRPSTTQPVAKPVRSTFHPLGLTTVAAPVLFHAWRA